MYLSTFAQIWLFLSACFLKGGKGRALVLSISNFINNSRYSTALVLGIEPSLDIIKNVLSLTVPVTLTPFPYVFNRLKKGEMTHLMLSHRIARLLVNRKV